MIRICQGLIFTLITLTLCPVTSAENIYHQNPNDTYKYWVFFDEKPTALSIDINDRSLERRMRRGKESEPTWFDLPVNQAYLNKIIESDIKVLRISKWLNAISVNVTNNKLEMIKQLPFVIKVMPVSSYSKPRELEPSDTPAIFAPKISTLDYGLAEGQIMMLGIDHLHDLNLTGRDIFIGIMDTGFDTSHVVFADIIAENRLIDTYDFLNNQGDVMGGDSPQQNHGTQVFSVIGGYDPGNLIGTAYGADFALAKTESLYVEVMAEEDNWVAAAEWMEGMGVDIITSALGYLDWYDTTQLDGRTAVITQAANIAVSLGMIVVNSAGNEGRPSNRWQKIVPPADGDSVIAVGGVDPTGEIAEFSSRGPTADGRIKPDFCAQGISVWVANRGGSYGSSQGTSYSAPLLAGGIALLLESDNTRNLAGILTLLKKSSNYYLQPNNNYGWGIPNFLIAYNNQIGIQAGEMISLVIAPQPAIDSVVARINTKLLGHGKMSVHNVSGDKVWGSDFEINEFQTTRIVWDGKNNNNEDVVSGIYIAVFSLNGETAMKKFFYINN